MKTKIRMYFLLSVFIIAGFTQVLSAQTAILNTVLTIVNNRGCPITINWEVSNCVNCPNSGCRYCNSLSTGIGSPPYITIPAAGSPGSTYVVDIALQTCCSNLGAENCTWYNSNAGSNFFDVFIGLIEIDNQPPSGGGIFGGVSCGCATGSNVCFSSTTTDSGSNSPAGCNTPWSMTWSNPTTGVYVVIN